MDRAFGALFDVLGRLALARPVEPALVVVPLPARAVRRLVARGELRARKIGRSWYAEPSDLRALLPPSRAELPPLSTAANDATPEVDGSAALLSELLTDFGCQLGPVSVAARSRGR